MPAYARHVTAPMGRVGLNGLVRSIARTLSHWAARRRTRLALADLDETLLRDIGIDPLTRDREIRRPFWQ
ncbi:uncharacterized protein YjiS (DUF1127 family) [Albidovulum inexpectatum]|uniref:Uncharacterized protein YjiS (DUF1127 family) n=1 Tax=Albidovulum inexpectatum TaxID=196587 RepID=A0A2S5JJI7_9RHOB|nr:uncharacterized protein YjiS (DUF1127 family) [Albidovulum inexpectatum]